MINLRTAIGSVFAAVILLPIAAASADATVNYHGYLYEHPQGPPVGGGFVVAGTFAPGFDPSSYFDLFGDEFGNVAPNHYSNAVAAGAFRPIGSPLTTSGDGFFNGSGSTTALEGSSVYLFAFRIHPDFGDIAGVITTGSSPTFTVPAQGGSTTIDAALADVVVFGSPAHGQNGGAGTWHPAISRTKHVHLVRVRYRHVSCAPSAQHQLKIIGRFASRLFHTFTRCGGDACRRLRFRFRIIQT